MYEKETAKLKALGIKSVDTRCGLLAEFNVGEHWYVISNYSESTFTLQENLDNGGIDYILDNVSFVKIANRIKKLLK